MDRKKFLKLSCSSAMAGMALASFPKAVRGKSQPDTDTYIGTWSQSEDIEIQITLYSEGIRDYQSSADYRTVQVKLMKNKQGTDEQEQLLNATYEIDRAPRWVDTAADIYRAEAKLAYVDINKRNISLSRLSFQVDFNSDSNENADEISLTFAGRNVRLQRSDTFICTACIQAKGLPRNCSELETLRAFRNQYAMRSGEGRSLISAYAIVGPQLVNVIENSINRKEIYASVYDTLVLPAIDLIKQGRKETAMQFYKNYIAGLKERMLN